MVHAAGPTTQTFGQARRLPVKWKSDILSARGNGVDDGLVLGALGSAIRGQRGVARSRPSIVAAVVAIAASAAGTATVCPEETIVIGIAEALDIVFLVARFLEIRPPKQVDARATFGRARRFDEAVVFAVRIFGVQVVVALEIGRLENRIFEHMGQIREIVLAFGTW